MIKKNERIYFCDELRGFAAFIVMLAHLTIGFDALKGFLYNPKELELFPSWFINLLPINGVLGVVIFFLISGFIIPLSLNDRKPFKFFLYFVKFIYM